jgi:hypothetical protein
MMRLIYEMLQPERRGNILVLEQEALYREFRLDEPWDGAHKRKVVERKPVINLSKAVRQAVQNPRGSTNSECAALIKNDDQQWDLPPQEIQAVRPAADVLGGEAGASLRPRSLLSTNAP